MFRSTRRRVSAKLVITTSKSGSRSDLCSPERPESVVVNVVRLFDDACHQFEERNKKNLFFKFQVLHKTRPRVLPPVSSTFLDVIDTLLFTSWTMPPVGSGR